MTEKMMIQLKFSAKTLFELQQFAEKFQATAIVTQIKLRTFGCSVFLDNRRASGSCSPKMFGGTTPF